MDMFKLEKTVKLYKAQFDEFNLSRTENHDLDRVSLELDAILFRTKYMTKKGISGIEPLRDEFAEKAILLKKVFGQFMYDFLAMIITIPDGCHLEDIHDVLAKDVKIDNSYVTFDMVLVSGNQEYLKFVDDSIPEDDVYNMFPNKYFRYETDSYNDAISRAYPELFEKRYQDKIGTGDDKDVFVHNLTFQVSERCSLNCTYCVLPGTLITMANGDLKPIESIQVGDAILGFQEKMMKSKYKKLFPVKVLNTFKHEVDEYYKVSHRSITDLYITGNHKVLTCSTPSRHVWESLENLKADKNPLLHYDRYGKELHQIYSYDRQKITKPGTTVYNLETETGTYIANGIAVHNCYQINKTPMTMDFDTAKRFIDHILNDDYGYINRYNSPAIIIEFIGGEPLLEITLIRRIYEYFLDRCFELNHPWFLLHRVSLCSNGLRYFDSNVQSFFKEYAQNVSFNISIDGNKKLHDSCRIQPNGEGSYDIGMAALNHYNQHYSSERNSKMTLAPSNIKYLFESVKDFIDHDMKCINMNCVFEKGWTRETAKIEYEQLKILADYILANDLENIYIAIFNEQQEDVQDKYSDSNFCGGTGSMTAIRPNGQIYPCIRYMPSSVGNDVKDLCMGTVDHWIERSEGSDVLELLDPITRRSQTNDICFECPISNDCPSCSGLSHTVFGTPDKKTTFICIQMVAEALANVYYWNKLLIKHPDWDLRARKNNVPDEWSLLVIDKNELELLKYIEISAMMTRILIHDVLK